MFCLIVLLTNLCHFFYSTISPKALVRGERLVMNKVPKKINKT